MTDYAVKVSVRNGRILRRMRECGIETQVELARRAGVSMEQVNRIVALRKKPLDVKGGWVRGVEEIAGVLGCDPDDLFSDAQRNMELPTNSTEIFMDEAQVAQIAGASPESPVWARIEVDKMLNAVRLPRDRLVVEERMKGATYAEIGTDLGICGSMVRQLEQRAHRQMKRIHYVGEEPLLAAELADNLKPHHFDRSKRLR